MKKPLCLILFLLIVATASGQFGQKYLVGQKTFGQRYGISPEGLVLWLDQSDPRSYGDLANWYDLSGQGNHAVQAVGGSQPAITGADGLNGSCREFDGGADFVGQDANPMGGWPFTLITWAKTPIGATGSTFFVGDKDSTQDFCVIGIDANGNAEARVLSAGLVRLATSISTVDDEGWHMLAGVFPDNSNRSIFVDGIFEDDHPVSIFNNSSTYDRWNIGRRGDSSPSDYFTGNISVVIAFNRALTAAEIGRLYLADKPRHGGL